MAIAQIPNIGYFKQFETNEIIQMGSMIPGVNEELLYMRVYLYINGALAGTERIRMKIYGENTYSSALYTSAYSSLSSITNISTRWLGWIRLDFSKNNLNKNHTYFLGCEINNYTLNGVTFYVVLKMDYINPVFGNSSSSFDIQPFAFEPYTYKVRVA